MPTISIGPVPIEFALTGGPIVRGLQWLGGPDTVLLLHDIGGDLDAWGSLPVSLAAAEYRVVAVDLPGHGLSDDPWETERAEDVLAAPCLIFVGGADPDAADAADRFFRQRRGWAVVSSFGVPENGAALLTGPWSTHLAEQTITFLRDYRTQPTS